MLKKILISTLLILSSLSSQEFKTPIILDIPEHFFVKQHWFSLTNTFDVETKERRFGTIHRKLFSLTPQYLFYDINEQLQAKAKMRFFSLGATFDIFDANEQAIGQVDERILTFFTTFDLYRADGYRTAKAKLNFWGTKYTVRDPQTDEIIAYLWRKFFRLKDDWTVEIVNPVLFSEKKIDPRLFILVMAFQTDRDYWASLRHHETSHSSGINAIRANHTHETQLAGNKSLEHYRSTLDVYREQFNDIEPTETDIENLEKIVGKFLDEQVNEVDVVLSQLIPLLDSEELSHGEKSALFFLMDQVVN